MTSKHSVLLEHQKNFSNYSQTSPKCNQPIFPPPKTFFILWHHQTHKYWVTLLRHKHSVILDTIDSIDWSDTIGRGTGSSSCWWCSFGRVGRGSGVFSESGGREGGVASIAIRIHLLPPPEVLTYGVPKWSLLIG